MNLESWAKQTFPIVEQDGECVIKVRLVGSDGETWHTWDAPFKDDWALGAEALVAELAERWPSRDIGILFIAEAKGGVTRSQYPMTVRGKDKSATNALSGETQALAQAAESWSKSYDKVLHGANTQITVLTDTCEMLGKELQKSMAFIARMQAQMITERQAELEKPKQPDTTASQELAQELIKHVPDLFTIIKQYNNRPANGRSNGAANKGS